MKISIVNGSPRANGATGRILRAIKSYLEKKEDVSIQYVDVSKLEMKYCVGCIHCYKTGNCVITDDDIEKVSNEIKQSDGVIIGSPTYGSNVSGCLKNFMDRGHFIVEQSLYGKQCFSVATYEIADGIKALNVIKKFFLVAGAVRSGDLLVKIKFNNSPETDRKLMKKLIHQTEKFYTDIRNKKRKSFFEWLFNDLIVVNIIWRRYFRKYPEQYRGILDLYRKHGIHGRVRV